MNIDEAIKHCEDVEKEQLKLYDICPSSESELYHCDGTKNCETLKNGRDKGCLKCAAEHRQFAEWLKDYKRLLEQTRWIPVSDRLPKSQKDGDKDYSDWVQITLHIGENNDTVSRAYYCFSEQKWYTDRLGIGVVTAWMPLLEPYRGDRSGTIFT